ncbi:YjbH domain-containing protein [Puniceibacterium sediminis]|uniref:Exopolysaccharide biosynthesis protein YbjH n=1 Tax=Puniceibacterium sediminis TaxID=1608407 RepID=A0A238WUJ2_9RHOB|nr:YjbH domain-containing protein [Puniceibacterium sediminis]SNR50176.1 Exopolysaccharide biosynthesis protein YbjH [Puniceibacterium sediminis]
MKTFSLKNCVGYAGIAMALSTGAAGFGRAQDQPQHKPWSRPTLNFMGVPGMIDMPTGHAMADADLAFSVGIFSGTVRNSAYFQITPRLSGVFRYSYIQDFSRDSEAYYDRSFDLRYLLNPETDLLPAVTVGLQDFGGTGIYAGEYVAATKTFGRLRATGGIGWGRFGSYNGFSNPLGILGNSLKSRPEDSGGIGQTGQLDTGQWFRGDAALFGGLQYQLNDQLVLTAEYSSDAYVAESARGLIDLNSPINIGASYRFSNGLDLSAAYLYGSEAAVRLTYTFNPKNPNKRPGGIEAAPPLVAMRAAGASADLGWTQQADGAEILRDNVSEVFANNGLRLDALAVDARSVHVRFRNEQYSNSAQAIGRATRILTQLMPASVETFVLTPVTSDGMPTSRMTLKRSDIEELVHSPDGAWQTLARADISDAYPPDGIAPTRLAFPDFTWGFGPYLSASYFDPRQPIRLDLGVELNARYELQPGLVFQGGIRHRLTGNQDEADPSNSEIRHVRSDFGIYAREGQTALSSLTAAKYFRPGEDLYGRVTVGYLESMYGGVSGELLWKPVASRLAFGVEANYARQRDFDQDFGFQDYEVMTGHLSTYYDAEGGFIYQVDAGRYLAGDWGATLSASREFDNGIRIGAFATFTAVSFDDFGEGSFDKGIQFEIPLSVLTGTLTQRSISRTLRPVQRDGGARLDVSGRLYEGVRDFHQPKLQSEWGRFWR